MNWYDLDKAIQFAFEYHEDQLDKEGKKYDWYEIVDLSDFTGVK